MVWACFSYEGKSELRFIEGNIDSKCYCSILETNYLPFLDSQHPRGAVLQQDNAPCHVAVYACEFLGDMDLKVLDWPSRSPDVNPIENIWGILAQRVNENGRQFDHVIDLKDALQMAWDTIELSVLQKLVD